MDWIYLGIAMAVVFVLVIYDFVTDHILRKRLRLPASAYFHDRIEPADIEQWKAKREAEEHERQLDHNLKNQQDPIPWQQVKRQPPQPYVIPPKPKPKRHYPRTKTTTIPMGSTHTASRTAGPNRNKFSSNSAGADLASLFQGSDNTQQPAADTQATQATTE